ncbi:MAG: hypothetical protein K6A90_11035, partial [Lachnospiraceae bacterium]|nr:hypothetical protein [Lachnospiraceae bacterium]
TDVYIHILCLIIFRVSKWGLVRSKGFSEICNKDKKKNCPKTSGIPSRFFVAVLVDLIQITYEKNIWVFFPAA